MIRNLHGHYLLKHISTYNNIANRLLWVMDGALQGIDPKTTFHRQQCGGRSTYVYMLGRNVQREEVFGILSYTHNKKRPTKHKSWLNMMTERCSVLYANAERVSPVYALHQNIHGVRGGGNLSGHDSLESDGGAGCGSTTARGYNNMNHCQCQISRSRGVWWRP